MQKTVAAIATPLGEGGIGTVRVSGEKAIEICDRVFKAKSSKRLADLGGYSALFGGVFDNGKCIDEAVALVFKAPKSYTGEDTVELSVHGGTYVLKSVLRAVLSAGADMAERGEFTRRAFLNGKLDLTEAEAVMDIISADGEQALRAGIDAKNGAVSKKCNEIKEQLTMAAAVVAAFSDYPDEEPEFSGIDNLPTMLSESKSLLEKLIADYDTGRMIKNGVNTVIIGPPNAGKSTLMNLASGYERSIVTSVAGTTRDVVEETVNIGGIQLRLSDTAGIRDTDDTVEKIGVERSLERANTADLIIAVFDGSDTSGVTKETAGLLSDRPAIVVFNKSDIGEADTSWAEEKGIPFVKMSAKDGTGFEDFCNEVKRIIGAENLSGGSAIYLNERQRNCCIKALKSVNEALDAHKVGLTVDAVGVCLDDALSALMELTGERVTVEVANKVFEKFCVGK